MSSQTYGQDERKNMGEHQYCFLYGRPPVLAICFFDACCSLLDASFLGLRLYSVSTGSKLTLASHQMQVNLVFGD